MAVIALWPLSPTPAVIRNLRKPSAAVYLIVLMIPRICSIYFCCRGKTKDWIHLEDAHAIFSRPGAYTALMRLFTPPAPHPQMENRSLSCSVKRLCAFQAAWAGGGVVRWGWPCYLGVCANPEHRATFAPWIIPIVYLYPSRERATFVCVSRLSLHTKHSGTPFSVYPSV